MPALGRLARGLSVLFWSLPLALIVCVRIGVKDKFELQPVDFLWPIIVTGLPLYGLRLIAAFQPQERIWCQALDRARIFALVCFGLSPFLYWRLKVPEVAPFSLAVLVLLVCGFLFLVVLNQVLQRLVAMLPDQALRQETHFFATLNQCLLLALPIIVTGVVFLTLRLDLPMDPLRSLGQWNTYQQWVFLLFILLPVAMTMALLWKIKEVLLASIFSPPS